MSMQFKSGLSTNPHTGAAVHEACAPLADFSPDLAIMFVSHHYGPEFEDVLDGVWGKLNCRNLIGCTGGGIIGPDREVEEAPGLVVWGAKMPGVRVLPFVIDQNDVNDFDGVEVWQEHLGVNPSEKPGFVVLPEPFSIDAESCLGELDKAFPGSTIVGGMASGASGPNQNRLFLNDQVLRQGLVGVSMSGPLVIDTVVSQGCRPIGDPFVITKADQNVIYELRGKPALDVLRGVFNKAAPHDQELMQQGLQVGNVVDEHLGKFEQGDFLVRNLMGVVQETGLAVNAMVRPGQTIQFHVRDGKSADEEMRRLLTGKVASMTGPPTGGLLFTCNGRGRRMFGSPNHDIAVVNEAARGCAVAGFFAAGEIGPVGKRTFIHGFTSSLVLFREAAMPTAG
ncbi:MAG: FIST C-terminal domain-containing protein [Planctomycetes bacterium]|nr:FIST C-terminal domain-containing protein [Planctomycetota bacterium]